MLLMLEILAELILVNGTPAGYPSTMYRKGFRQESFLAIMHALQ